MGRIKYSCVCPGQDSGKVDIFFVYGIIDSICKSWKYLPGRKGLAMQDHSRACEEWNGNGTRLRERFFREFIYASEGACLEM